MSGIRLYAEEGAAYRLQLDSMLKALGADNPEILKGRDADAVELIIRLQAAQQIAARIEETAPSLARRQGVTLAKVRTLADRP